MANKPQCFATEALDKQDILALKAVYNGEVDAHQQRLALHVIVNKLSRAQDQLYIPDSFDQTAHLNGRAFVGQKILKYINMPVGKLEEMKDV